MKVDKNKMALSILLLSRNEVSKTALNKLMFFSDYCYSSKYGNFEKTITNDNYIKLQYCPVPDSIEEVKNFCIYHGYLKKEVKKAYTRLGSYYTSIIPEEKLNIDNFEKEELEVVNLVTEKLSSETASSLSYFSHIIEPWKSSRYGQKLTPEQMKNDSTYKNTGVDNLYDLLKKGKYKEVINERNHVEKITNLQHVAQN